MTFVCILRDYVGSVEFYEDSGKWDDVRTCPEAGSCSFRSRMTLVSERRAFARVVASSELIHNPQVLRTSSWNSQTSFSDSRKIASVGRGSSHVDVDGVLILTSMSCLGRPP